MGETLSHTGPELFMTEVRVVDWTGTVRWYTDILGLKLALFDEPNGFALLTSGEGRLALKRAEGARSQGVRLVFQVADVDAEFTRLTALAVSVTAPADHPREPYREIRLADPDGTPISLFGWRVPG